MARSAGANKVTFTSAAPPIRYPHVYGINMPSRNELIAYNRDINQIENNLFIDKMIYQEVNDLTQAITQNSKIKELDLSCFTGKYVTGTVTDEYLTWVEETSLS